MRKMLNLMSQYNGLRHPGLVGDDSLCLWRRHGPVHLYGRLFWLSPGHSPGTGFVRVVMLVVTAALIGKLGLSYFGIL